jgi:CelD/BcsL family acetyltransferase involved in cellulose biosynthesis
MRTNLVDSEQDWVALRGEWDALVAGSVFPSIFLTFDYLFHAFRAFHAAEATPFLLVLRSDDGALIGIAPFRRSRRRQRGLSLLVLEYVTTWEVDKPYIIALAGHEAECWGAIQHFLHGHPTLWDLLELTEVPDSTGGKRDIERVFDTRDYRCIVERGPDGPIIDLTVSWPEFLRRHYKLSRAVKRLDKHLGGHDILTFDRPETIEAGIDRYMALEELSWKSGKHGLRKNRWHLDFYSEAIRAASCDHRVAIRLLARADELVAGHVCWEYGDTVYIHHTVYNPAFSHLSPGTVFMGLVLGEYMKTGRFKFADLLCGFADFYKPWAMQIVGTSHVQVFRLSAKTRLHLWLRGLVEMARARAQRPEGERRRPATEEIAVDSQLFLEST